MTDKEIKLLNEIEQQAMKYIERSGVVPHQITISDTEWKTYKNILSQGERAFINYNGLKWQLNVQCCSKTISAIDYSPAELSL